MQLPCTCVAWQSPGQQVRKGQLISTVPAMFCLKKVGCHRAVRLMACTNPPPFPRVFASCLWPRLPVPWGSSAGLLPPWADSFQLCPEHLGGSCSHPALWDVTRPWPPTAPLHPVPRPLSSVCHPPFPKSPATLHLHIVFSSFPDFISWNPAHGSTSKDVLSLHTILFLHPHTCAARSFPAITLMKERKTGTRGIREHRHMWPVDEGQQEYFSWQQCQHKVPAWTHQKPGSVAHTFLRLLHLCSWGNSTLITSYWDYW